MCELFLIFSLSGNSISDVGAVALGEMLKENESLKELKWAIPLGLTTYSLMLQAHACFCLIFSLSGNKTSDVGASVLGEMLKVNKSLKELKWATHIHHLAHNITT